MQLNSANNAGPTKIAAPVLCLNEYRCLELARFYI